MHQIWAILVSIRLKFTHPILWMEEGSTEGGGGTYCKIWLQIRVLLTKKPPYKQIWIKLANIYLDYLSFFLGGGIWGGVGALEERSGHPIKNLTSDSCSTYKKKTHAQKISEASWKFEFWPAKLMIHPTVWWLDSKILSKIYIFWNSGLWIQNYTHFSGKLAIGS